jgi:hypothetical protein
MELVTQTWTPDMEGLDRSLVVPLPRGSRSTGTDAELRHRIAVAVQDVARCRAALADAEQELADAEPRFGVAPVLAAVPSPEPRPVPRASTPFEAVPLRSAGAPRSHTGSGWLSEALRGLAAREPEAAGRALVDLLPLQGRVFSGPITYDLIVSDGPALAITVDERGTELRAIERPRPLDEVDGRVEASLAELGHFVRHRGGLMRRRTELRAEGRNKRQALAALLALTVARIGLGDLAGLGVAMSPGALLELLAQAIEPSWTIGHRFTVAFDLEGRTDPLALQVNDTSPPSVRLVLDQPVATVRCSVRSLPAVLLGREEDGAPSAALLGDRAALMLVQGWVARLEAGRG